ncbi:hypothetical protein GCM10025782_26920 [Pedococcus ginsenosidimutans]|uniref:Uncharacterized protein n=1 Tax=Pedococcus ginsenosidimutans TaxID=490570 RepID=A0ABP8YES8_9MICO
MGNNRADTFPGTIDTRPGSNANPNRAPEPVTSIERTSPTTSPRSFTSEATCSCDPIRSVNNVTSTTGVNRFWNEATDNPTNNATTTRNPTPYALSPRRDSAPVAGPKGLAGVVGRRAARSRPGSD